MSIRPCLSVFMAAVAVLAAAPARAHLGHDLRPETLWSTWSTDPWSLGLVGLSGLLYGIGVTRLWRRGAGAGIGPGAVAAFVLAWLSLVAALVSPLDPLGEALFAAHMVQHELLMLVAAPLFVAARPLAVWLWALPVAWRQRLARLAHRPGVAAGWRWLSRPAVAWSVHALVLWGWHAPSLFQAVLRSPGLHTLQHFSFFLSALVFWWAVMDRHRGLASATAALVYVFTTAVHTAVLGALLTFARQVVYPAYLDTAPAWGLTALEDQQLGGLIMWVPCGLVYLLVSMGLVLRVLQASEQRTRRWERYELTRHK